MALPYISRGDRRNEAEEHALSLLRVFGLDHLAAKQFRDLSGGEAQRLMLARAVAPTRDCFLWMSRQHNLIWRLRRA